MNTGELALSFGLAIGVLTVNQAVAADQMPYRVAEGSRVDQTTLQGWKTWRAMACERCHGPAQEGLVGPSLIEAMRRLSKEQFQQQLMKGSPDKGMPPFNTVEMINKNWEGLYAYLKGRSDGAIQPGRLEELN